jgi:hypothetical protein
MAPAGPLICWYDYGSAFTLQVGGSFTIGYGESLFTLA